MLQQSTHYKNVFRAGSAFYTNKISVKSLVVGSVDIKYLCDLIHRDFFLKSLQESLEIYESTDYRNCAQRAFLFFYDHHTQ